MKTHVRFLAVAAVIGTAAFNGAPVAHAVVCDPYSQACVQSETEDVQSETQNVGVGSQPVESITSPTTLPFTGGELVAGTALGIAGVVGGTLLVLAGRRRSAPTA